MKWTAQITPRQDAGLFDVLIHLHVMHVASQQAITAPHLVDVLAERGYRIGSRSVLALLRRFERRGWLKSQEGKGEASPTFRITPLGRKALKQAASFVSTLFSEISSSIALKSAHEA